MKTDKFGQILYDSSEIFDILMQDVGLTGNNSPLGPFLVTDKSIDIDKTNKVAGHNILLEYESHEKSSLEEFDSMQQEKWFMPQSYKDMNISKHVLSLCQTQAELQRCGAELLMYQERGLFDLLRYVKYLVDVMELNSVVWGVGRGSSVSSYVLYKLRLHKIDSMYYDLDVSEFLR